MEIKKVWAVYFSATDTTRRLAKTIAETVAGKLGCAYGEADFTLPAARAKTLSFEAGELVIFATPVYAGRVPNVLLPFLREKIAGSGAVAAPLVVFGNRNYDDALIELRNLLEGDGLRTVAAAAFVGEHAFSKTLGAGRPDAADLQLAGRFAEKLADKVIGFTDIPSEPIFVRGETPLRPYYLPQDRAGNPIDIRKVQPKTAENCSNCGLCASLCPMGSIDPADARHMTGICIKCGACVKHCPVGAKEYDDAGYLFHKTELEEIYSRRAEPELFV